MQITQIKIQGPDNKDEIIKIMINNPEPRRTKNKKEGDK